MGTVTNRQLFDRGPTCRGLAVDGEGVALGPILALVWRDGDDYAATGPATPGTNPTDTPRPGFLKEPPVTPVIPVTPEPRIAVKLRSLMSELGISNISVIDDPPDITP